MIVIIDNGLGAEKISNYIRQKTTIVDAKKASSLKNTEAFIISDGNEKNRLANLKIIKSARVPVLGIGMGSLFIANAYGSKIIKSRGKKKKRVTLKKACPLTLKMKKFFVVTTDCNHTINELPPNFGIVASSADNEYEIFQEFESPFFGVHFSSNDPEAMTIIRNFVKFLGVWEKYHRNF